MEIQVYTVDLIFIGYNNIVLIKLIAEIWEHSDDATTNSNRATSSQTKQTESVIQII